MKSRYAYLAGLTLLYVSVRLLVLFCAIDKAHTDEELYRGNITKELISGPIFPLFDYQRSEYEGGSLVNGVLAVPFFLLFGETLISLKLVGLLMGTSVFILWYLFLDRFFNKKVAVLTSALFILPPSWWIKISIFSCGSQGQINFFTIVAVFIFYQIFFVKSTKALFGLLGVVCGFSLFFHYSFLPTVLTIVLFWFIFDRKFFFRREFLIFAIAFLAGFAPWIWYNLTHDFQGLIVCDKPLSYWFARNGPFHFLLRIKDFVTIDLPGAFSFEDTILKFQPQALLGHWLLSRMYYFVFVLSFCALSWLNRRSLVKVMRGIISLGAFRVSPQDMPKEVFLLVFFVVFILVFSLSGIQSNFNYYESSVFRYRTTLPIGLFVPTLIVIFLYGKRIKFRPFFVPYLKFCFMALVLGLGLVSNLNFISKDALRRASLAGIYRGYNYYDLGRVIAWRFDGSPRWVDSVKRIKDPQDRRYCYSGMGWGYAEDKFNADYLSYLSTGIHKIERDYWPYACEWMGEAMERRLAYNNAVGAQLKRSLGAEAIPYFYRGMGREAVTRLSVRPEDAAAVFKQRIDEEYAPYFYEGIGVEFFNVLVNEPEVFLRFINAVDGRFKPRIYEGLAEGKEYYRFMYDDFGFGIGKVGYDIGKWELIMSRIEKEYRPFCYQRLGIEVGWRFVYDITKYVSFLKAADQEYRPYLYRGLGIGIGWRFAYDIGGCIAMIKYIDQAFWPSLYEGLGIGVARRYAYQKEAWAKGSRNIPGDYQPYFYAGIQNDSDRRYGGGD